MEQVRASAFVTHKDIAQALGVSVATIKHYRSQFPEFIPIAEQGKPLRFDRQVLDACKTIRKCFNQNLSIQDIRNVLYKKFTAAAPIPPRPGQNKRVSGQTLPRDRQAFAAEMKELSAQVRELIEKHAEIGASLGRIAVMLEGRLTKQPELDENFEKLIQRLERAVTGRMASFPPLRKTIQVKNSYGEVQEYVFDLKTSYQSDPARTKTETPLDQKGTAIKKLVNAEGEDKDLSVRSDLDSAMPSASLANIPPASFMDLPLVILSAQSDFLGAAGRARGTFTVRDFHELLQKNALPSIRFELQWEPKTDGWLLRTRQIQDSGDKIYELQIEKTRTPKGNQVALAQKLYVDSRLVPTTYLYTFIKQISSAVARQNRI